MPIFFLDTCILWKSVKRLLPLIMILSVVLYACTKLDANKYIERPAKQIYSDGLQLLHNREYQASAKAFEEVEQQHPYSSLSSKAQLMAAYAYYSGNRYDEAIVALDRFIQLHPSHPEVSYAYYLKGLCYYEQIVDITRDQEITSMASNALQVVVTKFPDSLYSKDARLKLDLTYDYLAGKEMEIGRFYMRQRQYLAAVNRFRRVVVEYQKTIYIPEALHRLVENYIALGLRSEAYKTVAILGRNFPWSQWYANSIKIVEN